MDNETFKLISTIDNLLILATFPINFAIYCSMSTQFRTTFKALFLRRNLLDADRHMVSMVSTTLGNNQHRQFSAAAANGGLLHVDLHQGGPSREDNQFSRSPAKCQTANG